MFYVIDMKLKNIIKLLLVLLWMGVIFSLSSQNREDSTKLSDSIINKTINIMYKDKINNIKRNQIIESYTNIVRKLAHIIEYAILGILLFYFLKDYLNISFKLFLLAIIICMIYASTDEIHQIFVSGRGPQVTDVLIDSFGSLMGISVMYLIGVKNEKS